VIDQIRGLESAGDNRVKKLGMLVALLGLISVCTAYLVHSQGKSKTPTLTTDDVGRQGKVGASPTQGAESGAYRNQTLSKDGPVTVTFFELFQKGPTTVFPIDPSTVVPLPVGYAPFNGIVYDVKTEAVGSGPTKVLFNVPSVGDSAVFSNLRILHLEKDSLDYERLRWVDRTILTPDTPAPDFCRKKPLCQSRAAGKVCSRLRQSAFGVETADDGSSDYLRRFARSRQSES
jgi:hypothetical protein